MSKIQLGVIGYGGMGKYHAKHVPSSAVNVIAVADILPERISEAREDGFRTCYDTAEGLIADKNIDTVVLAVPNYLHKELCIKAAKAGKNVIDEKPAALNVAELDEMERVCKEEGVIFSVHHNRRWDRDMLTAKYALDNGLLGNVFTIESTLHSGNGYMHDWHVYKKFGGGMMFDWGVHLLDQILFMMPNAKVKSLYADIKKVLHEEVDDYFKIILKMDNGITAHVELGTYILKTQPRWLLGGDKGTMVVNNIGAEGILYKTTKILEKLPPRIAETTAGPTRQFAPMPPGTISEETIPAIEATATDYYINFRDVIYAGAELKVKIPEVRRVLSLIEAAHKSSETGEAILFE